MPGQYFELNPKVLKTQLPAPDPRNQARFDVQMETLDLLSQPGFVAYYHELALANHRRWAASSHIDPLAPRVVRVFAADWGNVTLQVTIETGHTYAVLNMANAYGVGGGFLHGMIAQEENIFRRTDCAASIDVSEIGEVLLNEASLHYTEAMTHLINGDSGRVYVDADHPRVCFRGAETPSNYAFLPPENVFQFIEMRAAALNLSCVAEIDTQPGSPYYQYMQQKIEAQFLTLMEKGIRHVVLSAFGCGAFHNKAEVVAAMYKEQITKYATHFDDVVFAIYDSGYGPRNAPVFEEVLGGMSLAVELPVLTHQVDQVKIQTLINELLARSTDLPPGHWTIGDGDAEKFLQFGVGGVSGLPTAALPHCQVMVDKGELIYLWKQYVDGRPRFSSPVTDSREQEKILNTFLARIAELAPSIQQEQVKQEQPQAAAYIPPVPTTAGGFFRAAREVELTPKDWLINELLVRSTDLPPGHWTIGDGDAEKFLQFGVGGVSGLPTAALPHCQVMVDKGELIYLWKQYVDGRPRFSSPVTDSREQEQILNIFINRIAELLPFDQQATQAKPGSL